MSQVPIYSETVHVVSSSLIALSRESRTRHFDISLWTEEFPENVRNSLRDKGVGSPGRIRTSNISVNRAIQQHTPTKN
jgi:hypothetical protein